MLNGTKVLALSDVDRPKERKEKENGLSEVEEINKESFSVTNKRAYDEKEVHMTRGKFRGGICWFEPSKPLFTPGNELSSRVLET